MAYPVLNSTVLLLPGDEGHVIFDPDSDLLHQLNPVASLIVELCDGSRTVEDIRDLVAPFLPEGTAQETERWIEQAIDSGLLIGSATPAACPGEISLDELRRIATRLEETRRLQVSFLCWSSIVQRQPNDADAWYALGDVAYWLGRYGEARAAYGKYLESHPEDAELQHFVAALGTGAAPARAPDACVEQIYRGFAPDYDSYMRERLNYEAPERLFDAMAPAIGDRRGLAILDLGCGSGLSGIGLKTFARELVGVDLSPEMIALARQRNIYDRLDVAEITFWLERCTARFDIIVACECLEYFGDLGDVVASAARLLDPNGILALTVERGETYPFQLTKSGRYAHHIDHVREAAARAGLTEEQFRDGFLRKEYGKPAIGYYAVFRKKPQNHA